MIKKLLPLLNNSNFRDTNILLPFISKPILLLRNIILERFVPQDQWKTYSQLVDNFSQILIDMLGLKLKGQSVLIKQAEFRVLLEQLSLSFKTLIQ